VIRGSHQVCSKEDLMPRSERLRLEKAARKEKDKKHYQRLQMVMLRTQGLTQPAIAAVVERAGL
jgi:hypothetical protein